ncbi:MAG: hypothetical protein LBC12_01835 [Nitrososphaerota archaeon]|jgi:hypothetical protein|nr:hypothetical protein [Nitrososphaerota archaeon]
MKKLGSLLLIVFLVCCSFISSSSVANAQSSVVVPANSQILNLRFSDEEYTMFSSSGYRLDEKSGGVNASFGASYPNNVDVAFSFRVWIIGQNGYEVELTEGVPAAVNIFTSGNGIFSGFISSSWNCPNMPVLFGDNALRVVMYSATDDGANTVARAVFVSPVLITSQIVASTWTFSYYVDYEHDSFMASWSGAYGQSGINGIVIIEPSVYDVMFFKLTNRDFAGFLLYPYLDIFGSIFYVIVIVALLGAYYLWTGKMSVVIFMLILFGSAGGVVFVFLPAPANILVWLLMAVGLGVLLFRVFR